MTCARREAGARRPAPPAPTPSTSIESPRALEPRPGRFGARLFFFPALALLLGALSLFHAAPALAQVPAAPTGLTVSPADEVLELAWAKSTGATGYNVHYTSAPASGNGAVTNSASVQTGATPSVAAGWVNNPLDDRGSSTLSIFDLILDLANGTAYRVRVRAVNASGNSAWVFGSGTPAIVLEWPLVTSSFTEGGDSPFLAISAASISAAVSGTLAYAPGSSNPATLAEDLQTGYATTFSHAMGQVAEIELPTAVDDTVNEENETFDITINAGTGYVVGTPSTLTVTIIDNDPPAAPALSLTEGAQQLTASWTKPDGPVARYEFRYKTASAPDQPATGSDESTGWRTFTLMSTTTSRTITGLTSDTAYHVQVRATDGQTQTGNGFGAWSTLRTGTPPSPPAAPSLNVAPGNAQLTLTWVKPSGPVTGYDVHYTSAVAGTVGNDAAASGSDPSAAWVAVSRSGTTAAQTISSLTNDADYRVRVRAVNAGGDGAWAFGTGTPRAAPTVSLEVTETVSEGDYPVRIIAELSEPSASDVQVQLTLTLDTAELADFATEPDSGVVFDAGASPVTGTRTLTVPAGEYNAEFDLYTVHDEDGADETFTVAIDTNNLPTGYIAGAPTSAQVTIDDDETRNPDPGLLTGLTINDGMRELYFDANTAGDQVGLGGPDAIYTVQVNPGIRSVTVTPAWTNSAITRVNGTVRYITYGRDGAPLTWDSGESGTGKVVVLQAENLSAQGTTELTLTVTRSVDGVTSTSDYRILFQHNFDWENANNRLSRLVMQASQ